MDRVSLKNKAKETLNKNRWGLVLVSLVGGLLIGVATAFFVIPGLIVGPVLMYGIANYIYLDKKGEHVEFNILFSGFDKMGKILGVYYLGFVQVLLWSLLLIVPGVIKTLAFSQAYFVLLENPNMSASDILKKSESMMNNHKWEMFVLMLSFLGWLLLGSITLGILNILYVTPYMLYTFIYYYDALKAA